MIVRPRGRCAAPNCSELALWGKGATTKHCDAHKEESEVNLVEGACANCGLMYVLRSDGTCQSCEEFGHVKRNHLEKQRRVKAALEAAKFRIESYDRMLDQGLCSRKRPDFVIDGIAHAIVVECDEYQHRGASYACEERRMWDIAQALGRPTIFVRYNPDGYKDAAHTRQDPPAARREEVLVRWVRHLMAIEPTGDFLSVIYLYYDGFERSEDCRLEPVGDPMAAFEQSVGENELLTALEELGLVD